MSEDNKIDEKLEKILEKVNSLSTDSALIKKDVGQNTRDLSTHIKRTNLLEERMEQHATYHEKQLDEALIPIRWIKTSLKILAAAAVITGLLKTLGLI